METYQKRSLIILELFFLFVAPVALLYFKIIPLQYHRYVLFIFTVLFIILAIKDRLSLKKLGIYKDKPLKFYLPYILFTVIGVIFIYTLAELIGHEPLDWDNRYLYVFLVLPLSFSQEFIYRAYLMNKLESLFNSEWTIILINACLFAIMHIIFANIPIILPLALVSGIAFAWIYYKYRNLLLISLSHSILNFTAVLLYGFFK